MVMKVEYKKLKSELGKYQFVIEEDVPEVGAYLYIYENGSVVRDYLQDNIRACQEFALEEYNVPIDNWQLE